ncbi:MAG TPA: hypothetical protein VK438_18030 [Xanthobacteraceae bacterium]|nr:hypothetical protein [Xanthobacteraceae bacterium]
MSSESIPVAARTPRTVYWIAGAASLAVAALLVVGVVKLAGPAKFMYGFVSGNPVMPGCSTSVASEATVGPVWYRTVNLGCGKEQMHFIYVKRGTGPGWFVLPAVMSVGDPVPVSVRQAGADAFEVVLSKPLADGRTSLPIAFDRNGMLKEMLSFDHGRERDSVALGRG